MSLEVIEGKAEPANGQIVREYGRLRVLWGRLMREVWHFRLKRWIPRLVWLGDEIDVVVTLTEDKLPEGLGPADNPLRLLFSGGLFEIEKQLRTMGITFDTSMGFGGRDWEWDYSLAGPISVRFKGRAKHPERRVRKECPKPRLVETHG